MINEGWDLLGKECRDDLVISEGCDLAFISEGCNI